MHQVIFLLFRTGWPVFPPVKSMQSSIHALYFNSKHDIVSTAINIGPANQNTQNFVTLVKLLNSMFTISILVKYCDSIDYYDNHYHDNPRHDRYDTKYMSTAWTLTVSSHPPLRSQHHQTSHPHSLMVAH